MTFYEAISKVTESLKKLGTSINGEDYDGVAVKKLAATNTLEEGRSTNQTHIAITGEQMDMFPSLCPNYYFGGNTGEPDDDLKKYFVMQVPVRLFESNCLRISPMLLTLPFDNGVCHTKTSIVRSKRRSQTDQLQVSMLNMDGPDFVSFRKQIVTNSYLIFLKRKSLFEYDVFAISPNMNQQIDDSLAPLNNQFYKIGTNTIVPFNAVETTELNSRPSLDTKPKARGGYNKIYYGAPGCGKSYYVKHEILGSIPVERANQCRTTFHPDYSNADFVGQIMPVVETIDDPSNPGKTIERVSYKFNPGPFALALKRSYETEKMVYLVIEEINRGNASAIFGDLFQLLDRARDSTDKPDGESEYHITHVALQKYLSDELKKPFSDIVIPSNLTILATMNSSDQNVFTLDTAFKRRWEFEQISNDIDADTKHPYKDWFVPGTDVTWAAFLKKINAEILRFKIDDSSNEDKRLGKYFVTKDCLTEKALPIGSCEDEANNFAYKVLEYLWNDVCKLSPDKMFDIEANKTLEDLIESFKHQQLSIFRKIDFKA